MLNLSLLEMGDSDVKCELYNDHFENAKRYNIPRA
ncbi:site-specific DNA-methyltransferase, partial [Streptococcus pyogenes]